MGTREKASLYYIAHTPEQFRGWTAYWQNRYREVYDFLNIDPANIQSATVLGCGQGYEVAAALKTFPNATIYGVDDYRYFDESLKANPRFVFLRGHFVDQLRAGVIPPSDLITMQNVGTSHGFDQTTVELLLPVVGNGYLFTGGYNSSLQGHGFLQNHFDLLKEWHGLLAIRSLWTAKK